MLSWLIVDVAMQWAGWAVSALLKVSCSPVLFFWRRRNVGQSRANAPLVFTQLLRHRFKS
jgi:hypothetical protein